MADDSVDAARVEPLEADEADQDPETSAPDEPAEPDEAAEVAPTRTRRIPAAGLLGGVLVVVLAALTGWLGYEFSQAHRDEQQRAMFVQTAEHSAVALTSIGWETAEGDIKRVLDGSTGRFYDDFQKRSESFLEVVKQIKSKSTGTVTSSGLGSYSGDKAEVLVSVTVQASNAGVPEQAPQVWRMLLTVEKAGDGAKVSDVEFIQ